MSFRNGLIKIREELVIVADQCARTGEPPEQPIELEVLFESLRRHTLPVQKSLVPPGFPEPKTQDVNSLLVASDFWEERGDSRKSEFLRQRAECLEHCRKLLDWATLNWCQGHPERPSTLEITHEMVDEMEFARFVKKPYGIKNREAVWTENEAEFK